jgi:hypothetical protein
MNKTNRQARNSSNECVTKADLVRDKRTRAPTHPPDCHISTVLLNIPKEEGASCRRGVGLRMREKLATAEVDALFWIRMSLASFRRRSKVRVPCRPERMTLHS